MADNEQKDQKTEEATPKRREESREKGQVALSQELVASVGLCVGTASLLLGAGALAQSVGDLIVGRVSELGPDGRMSLNTETGARLVADSVRAVGLPLALVTLPAIALSGLTGYLQVGLRITPKAIEVDPNKVNPAQGFGRLFSMRSAVRTAMAALKVSLITSVVAFIAWWQVGSVIQLGTSELGPLLRGIGHLTLRCLAGALAVIVLLSVVDAVYQRFQLGRDLRMTKQEVKDEMKVSEGDPHIKARVRQLQREMATRRMMADVPKATVVVTNPDHYAVCLKYERDEFGAPLSSAPVCIAKGADHLAQRIKQVAAEAEVVCYEDVPLARALYAQVKVGDEIPEDLYAAVAVVLGYVLRLRGEVASA